MNNYNLKRIKLNNKSLKMKMNKYLTKIKKNNSLFYWKMKEKL